jgi:signal transduction histidine kinase
MRVRVKNSLGTMKDAVLVLLVNQEKTDRLLQDLLLEIQDRHFAVERAATFEEACDKLDTLRPDIALIDYELGTGAVLALLSRSAQSKVPIIVLTEEDARSDTLEAVQAGAVDYLIKDRLNAMLLEKSIHFAITLNRTREQLRDAREQLEERVRERTAELTRFNEELQKADRIKDEFLAIMSHELRTPLTPILGWSRMLKSGAVGGEQFHHGLEVIERNAQLEARLVEDVLDASRIITGKLRLDFHWVNLGEVLRQLVQAWQPLADSKNIVLVSDFQRVPFLWGNAQRLHQIFSNLLSNAFKFTPPHGKITLSAKRIDGRVTVQVSDTGIGIKPEFLPHVFERFRQADSSTTRKHGGLGLGLTIVRYLVEVHGGLISAESKGAGTGATFTVTLPDPADRSQQEAV